MKLTRLFTEFFNSEKAGGLVLLFCTVLSLVLTNTGLSGPYLNFWETRLAGHNLTHWINDGLICIFFLLIGLELEREIYQGELSDIRNAILPVFSALGGMAVPAGIYLLVNFGLPGQSGAGIPMATDIAFAIGMLSLLGKRVPPALKVFLVAMAIIDDLGAILVIAFFYSAGLSLQNLGIAGGIFALLLLLNRLRIHALLPYLAGGVAMWYFMLHSGVHATITGVLLAFAIPFGDGGEKSPSFILQHFLHAPVAFIILPVFALANTAIAFDDDWIPSLVQPVSLGILSGLIIGKPVGILLFSRIASASGLGNLPAGIKWTFLAGTGMLGGIGFTMSIFISLLAFEEARLIGQAKISVMLASLIAALSGLIWLYFNLPVDSGDPNQSTEKNA